VRDPFPTLQTGPSLYSRQAAFPYIALFNGALYATWPDADASNTTSLIYLSKSTNGGVTWSAPTVVSPSATGVHFDVQPAMVSGGNGLHIDYYRVADVQGCGPCYAVYEADSPNGSVWKSRLVSSTPFPGVPTLVQFDPQVAQTYMGDYIAIASDGASQYLAWGDNRNTVCDYMWPQCRHDPDVYAAHVGG
jgi:hypothetical protein